MKKLYLILIILSLLIISGCEQIPEKYKDKIYCEQVSDCSPKSCGCYNQYYKLSIGITCGVNPEKCDCINNACISLCNNSNKVGETWREGKNYCECSNAGTYCFLCEEGKNCDFCRGHNVGEDWIDEYKNSCHCSSSGIAVCN